MFKKHFRDIYLIGISFVAGVLFVIQCGGAARSVAQSVADAIDVLFDNTASALSASNVQDAIDELAAKLKTGDDLAADLAGSWSGTYCNGEDCDNISMTLDADGGFTCDDGGGDAFSGTCDDPNATWSVLIRVFRLSFTRDSDGEVAEFYNTTWATSTTLEMSDGVQHLYSLTKS